MADTLIMRPNSETKSEQYGYHILRFAELDSTNKYGIEHATEMLSLLIFRRQDGEDSIECGSPMSPTI